MSRTANALSTRGDSYVLAINADMIEQLNNVNENDFKAVTPNAGKYKSVTLEPAPEKAANTSISADVTLFAEAAKALKGVTHKTEVPQFGAPSTTFTPSIVEKVNISKYFDHDDHGFGGIS